MCGIGGFHAYKEITGDQLEFATQELCDLLVGLETRGRHAAGLFTVDDDLAVKTCKGPGPASDHLPLFEAHAITAGRKPIVIGHTRNATHGTPSNNRNNHPFTCGRITGVHNGVFHYYDYWRNQLHLRGDCDSEAIFAMLASCKNEGGYNKVLARLNPYNRVIFWDDKMRRLYTYCADVRGLAFAMDKELGVTWMASTKEHLPARVRRGSLWAQPEVLYIATERRNGVVRKESHAA